MIDYKISKARSGWKHRIELAWGPAENFNQVYFVGNGDSKKDAQKDLINKINSAIVQLRKTIEQSKIL